MMRGCYLDLNDMKGDILNMLPTMGGVNTSYMYIGECSMTMHQ